ncbi:MAG: MG2 domain-containing protein, partial [Saezia sp.]
PEAPEQKKVVATIRATHPLDQKKVIELVSLELGKGVSYQDKQTTPEIFFSDNGLEAYIHSPLLEMPLEKRNVTVHLSNGLQAKAGGNIVEDAKETVVSVPGLYQLSFEDAELIFVDNNRGEPEQVFVFSSSHAISDDNIKGNVQAWLLPKRSSRSWNYSDVTESVLSQSEVLALTHIGSDEPQNSVHAFRYNAPSGRYIYIQVKPHVESLGGYLSRDAENIALQQVPEFPKQLGFLSDGALLSLNGEKQLGIMSRGISHAKVEISRILPNQLHHLVNQLEGNFRRPTYAIDESYLDKLVERQTFDVLLPAHDPAKLVYGHVDFTPYLNYEGGRKGIFLLRLTPTRNGEPDATLIDTDETRDLRFIVVTDLGIIAKKNVDGSHDVFVQSISNGSPVSEATVMVYGANGLPVASAKTDESGRVHFENLEALQREKLPIMYAVMKENDLSFLPIGEHARQLDFSRFAVEGIRDYGRTDTLRSFMFSERGLYRPGETAHLGMIVRSSDWQSKLSGLPVELRIIDPRGKLVQENKFNLSQTAFESIDFTSSPNAPAGSYTAQLYLQSSVTTDQDRLLGHVNFNVRDFEPDRMKVSVSLFPTPVLGWVKPQDVQAKVSALHLFGAPASDRRVVTSIRLTPAYTQFKGFEDYHFYWRNAQQ